MGVDRGNPVLELFRERFVEQAGRVHVVSGFEECARLLRGILEDEGIDKLAVASCNDWLWNELENVFKGSEIKLIQSSRGVAEVRKCEAGLTFPELAIAETGSILEINEDDSDRLVSSLTRIHAAYLPANKLVKSLNEVAPVLRKYFRLDRLAATLISGPSRTADVEMRLVLGVHGPHEVHVFLKV